MRSMAAIPAMQLRSASGRYVERGPRARMLVGAPPVISSGNGEEQSQPRLARSEMDALVARVEAILFLAREPLSSRKLCQYSSLADGTQARTLVRRLNERYDAAGRAFRVEQVAGGYQLLTRRNLAPWLRRLAHVPGQTRLSPPALETLAVIAYRQPVARADIEAVRGVNCGEILRQLMDRDLVRLAGRSAELGRPFLYGTTKRFLELFGLNHLGDLPGGEALGASPLPEGTPAVPLVEAASPMCDDFCP
jgi:segregation and condensation protein B